MLSIEIKSENRIQRRNAAGELHRLNGPADVDWHSNGQKWFEGRYRHNKLLKWNSIFF